MQVSGHKGVVLDVDDFRQGNSHRPNTVSVYKSGTHKVELLTIQAGQSLPVRENQGAECIMLVMGGMGEYCDGEGNKSTVDEGMMMVAPNGAGHGIKNIGNGPLVILAIH